MAIKFNPFTSNFDFVGDGGVTTYLPPVATEADLPLTDLDGSCRVVLATDRLYVFDLTAQTWTDSGTVVEYSTVSDPSGLTSEQVTDGDVIRPQITLHAADETNPGALTAVDQTIAGDKTFNDKILADGGIDVNVTAGVDTLSIGISNADVINIGWSGATVNINGDTVYQNVTNLNVADKNINLNDGGGAGSASGAGIDIEEAGVVTGYANTSANRLGWDIKAPASAGVAQIIPGASGILLNQSSHDPVTIGTANGLSLSTQALSLAAASSATTGALTSTDHQAFTAKVDGPVSSTITAVPTFASTSGKLLQQSPVLISGAGNVTGVNNLTVSGVTNTQNVSTTGTLSVSSTATVGSLVVTGSTTLNTGLTGVARVTAGVVSAGNVDAATEISGVLPVANGGTGSATPLTNGQLYIGNTGNIPTHATLTGTGITVTNGPGSINLSLTVPPNPNDVPEGSFTSAASQTGASVTGFSVSNAAVRSLKAQISVFTTSNLAEIFDLSAVQTPGGWSTSLESAGSDTGYSFSVNSSGQVTYNSSAVTASIHYRATVTSV